MVDSLSLCDPSFTTTAAILTSSDKGETWAVTADNSPFADFLPSQLNNAKISVSADGSRVWVSLLRDGQDATIAWSDDHGDSWTIMDKIKIPGGRSEDGLNPRNKPGGQGGIHFSLLGMLHLDLSFDRWSLSLSFSY